MADLITKIKYKNEQGELNDYDIGTNAENVFFETIITTVGANNEETTSKITHKLTDLINYLKKFFENGHFVYQGENAPTNEKIIIWNQLSNS